MRQQILRIGAIDAAGHRTMTAAGYCLCGQLQFTAQGQPRWVVYCHCATCRRHTGSPVTAFVNFLTSDVTFRGDRATFASSPGVQRSFCAHCGSPIGYETAERPAEIDIYVNAFSAPEQFTPTRHVHFEEHLPWLNIDDGLPRRSG